MGMYNDVQDSCDLKSDQKNELREDGRSPVLRERN